MTLGHILFHQYQAAVENLRAYILREAQINPTQFNWNAHSPSFKNLYVLFEQLRGTDHKKHAENYYFTLEKANLGLIDVNSDHKIPIKFKDCNIQRFMTSQDCERIIIDGGRVSDLRVNDSANLEVIGTEVLSLHIHEPNFLRMTPKKIVSGADSFKINTIEKWHSTTNCGSFSISGYEIVTFESRYNHTTLKNVVFNRCNFHEILGSSFITLKGDVYFDQCTFSNVLAEHESIYRHFKKDSETVKNEFNSHMFGALELKCRHNRVMQDGSLPEKIFSFSYWIINDFGLDAYRPLWGLVTLTTIAAFVEVLCSTPSVEVILNSFLIFIGPFKLIFSKDVFNFGSSSILYGNVYAQFFFLGISSLLWFFQILAIRRRFKVT